MKSTRLWHAVQQCKTDCQDYNHQESSTTLTKHQDANKDTYTYPPRSRWTKVVMSCKIILASHTEVVKMSWEILAICDISWYILSLSWQVMILYIVLMLWLFVIALCKIIPLSCQYLVTLYWHCTVLASSDIVPQSWELMVFLPSTRGWTVTYSDFYVLVHWQELT